MFSHESTENLLDNLESELTEMIELDIPKIKNRTKDEQQKISTPQKQIFSPEKITKKREPPPVPARRNISRSPLTPQAPTPATRRVNSLDKIDKDTENEIIQLQSLNSDHESLSSGSQKISQASSKNNTVVSINEKKKKESMSKIRVIHEAEKMPDDINETFFVIKHGKWAEEETKETKDSIDNDEEIKIEKEIEESQSITIPSQKSIETTDEKPTKKKEDKKKNIAKKKKESTTSSITTTLTSSSSESSSEEIPQPKKKSKNQKSKNNSDKKKSRKVSEEQTPSSNTEESKKESEKIEIASSDKAIGVYVNNMGPMKYKSELKGLKIKISFYNEDNGKQIGDTIWTKEASYNNDFYNFICSWNENIKANFDLKRLREIYNSILIFFEVINSETLPVCWAFIKLFSPNTVNIDKKFKLQFYEYQSTGSSCFPSIFGKAKNLNENVSIYEQWQLSRKKFPSILNIYLKDISLNSKDDSKEIKEDLKVNKIHVLHANESSQRHWRKIPGQACRVPKKIFQKVLLQDKGSLNVKFSHDGNFLAFSEVSKNGHLLHVYKFPEMSQIFMMLEHSDIIHDIDWRKQKQYKHHFIVTASADFTAIVWKLLDDSYTYSILPHPAFVYASKFLQNDENDIVVVVTACRDNIIRIWKNRQGMESFELCQELKHPKTSPFTYITSVITRNADVFYSSSSVGDIIEWTLNDSNEYQLNRHFRLDECRGRIINNMEINPRGNKICFRLQDCHNYEVSNAIYILGITTGTLTQKFHQFNAQNESQGHVKISPCGTQIYCTNGPLIRHYQMINGSIVAADGNKNALAINCPLGNRGFISSLDYHPKDFFLVCGIYGGNPGGIIIFSFETDEKDPIEVMKMGSQDTILQKSLEAKQIGVYSDIIKRLDEVFLAPSANQPETNEILKVQEYNQPVEDNTFTIQSTSKRSKTYTVSQGPATFTIQKGGTYEIQKNDNTDEDETTISESLN